MKWFWKLILLSILNPNMRRFVQDFFFVIDRYVRQVRRTDQQRAMTAFYNFCSFNILGIVQFNFSSSTVLLPILFHSTCLNSLISMEDKNKWNILITSIYRVHPTDAHFGQFSKSNFLNKCWFFSPKSFKGHSQLFRSFLFV